MDASQWHALLDKFDDANIYQTWSYGAVHWSPEELSHLVLTCDGKAVAAVQLRIVRMPVLNKGIAYIRGGPLCRLKGQPFDETIPPRVLSAVRDEYVQRRGLSLRLISSAFETDDFASAFLSAYSAIGLKQNPDNTRPYRTVRVNLTGSLEDLRKNLSAKWRNKLNGAERNGLNITEGSSLALYDKFMTAYQEMMARKNFETTVDVLEFRKIQMDLPEQFKMQIFLCEKDGRLLNALVVAAIGDTAIYLLGATSDEGLKLKGAYLLQWRAIQWLKQQGCRWYDLGGINAEDNPGVYEFKSGFGGEEAQQLGTFDRSGDWLSTLCVDVGERANTLRSRLKKITSKSAS